MNVPHVSLKVGLVFFLAFLRSTKSAAGDGDDNIQAVFYTFIDIV